MKLHGLLILPFVLGTSRLSAQSDQLAGRLDARTYAAVTAIIDSAAARGLPTRPLRQKALEGASKGADGPAIEQVVRATANRMETARRQLGSDASEADLGAAAAALYVGVSPETLARLRATSPGVSLTVPLVTLTFLVHSGIEIGASSRWVESLLTVRANNEEFMRLQQSIDEDLRNGATPSIAAQNRVQALLRRYGGREP